MKVLKKGKQIGRTLKYANRLKKIVAVFAKHGFHNVAERIKLGRFVLERLSDEVLNKYTLEERIRMSFEELGPTFVKLGQVLASRPDLVPQPLVDEFSKFHDQVTPLPFDIVKEVISQELGGNLSELFDGIDEKPIGCASIAQVHRAKLKNGDEVVIKVQRPGIVEIINDDLSVLYMLAELLESYVEESRAFNPAGIVDEFFKTLEYETNFLIEANNVRRFIQNFKGDEQIKIPKVYLDLTTEKILVLEYLDGLPLSNPEALKAGGINPEEIIRAGLKCYLKMVFKDGLFHGDLHPGNFLVFSNNQVGLIDFGVVGRLNKQTQNSIVNMLMALANEDYERLANEYMEMAPFDDRIDVDLFAKDLRDLVAPYYGLTLKNVNTARLLMGSASVAAKHHLRLPTELMMFFKSIVAIDALGRKIIKDFDFLTYSLEFATDLAKQRFAGDRITSELTELLRDSGSLLNSLPRHLKYLMRKVNSPDHSFKIKVDGMAELKVVLENSYYVKFLSIVIAALILSSSLILVMGKGPLMGEFPVYSFVGYALAGLLGFFAFLKFFNK